MSTDRRTLVWTLTGVVWLVLSAAGMAVLMRHAHRPGAMKLAPRISSLPAQPASKAHLLVFVHPECPCSEATMEELNRLMAREGTRFRTSVYVHTVGPHAQDVAASRLGKIVSRLPGVELLADAGGAMAERHGALTSGTVVLYDATGQLRFQGGLTESRGHAGENAFTDALQAQLRSPQASATPITTHVFGCSIF